MRILRISAFVSILGVLVFGYGVAAFAGDPSGLLEKQDFLLKMIDDSLQESMITGVFGTIAAGQYYLAKEAKDEGERTALDFVAWLHYVNSLRLLNSASGIENIDPETAQTIKTYLQQISAILYKIGNERFGWNQAKTDQMYARCQELIVTRLKAIAKAGFQPTATTAATSKDSGQRTGKPLPISRSGGLVENCAGRIALQSKLPPKDMRIAIDQCLAKAGYSYTATLKSLAEDGFGLQDLQNIMFLTMPAGVAKKEGVALEEVYSSEEVGYLQKIKQASNLNMY